MLPFLLTFAISLTQTSGILTGRVLDPHGKRVPNATVVVLSATSPAVTTRTDDEGRYEVPVPAGRVDVVASAPGLSGEVLGVESGGGHDVDVTVQISAVAQSVVVSAAQIDQPLSRVADTVSIIDRNEINARQLLFVADALASVPGLTLARNGGPGTLTSVFPRGGESDFTLVLVDGVRANAFGGGIDLSQVPLGDVERIEVVRGPQSALFGSDAIGGVVQILTRAGGRPSATGRIEAGSRNTRRVAGSTTGEQHRWTWQAGGDVFADDGFSGVATNGERVSNDDAQERQAWIGGGYRWQRGTDARGNFHYIDTDRGSPGPYGSDPAHRFSGVDRISRGTTDRRSGGVRVAHPWGGAAGRVRQRIEFDSAVYGLDFASAFGMSESETRRSHLRVQTDAALDDQFSASAGIEWLGEEATSTFITAAADAVPVRRHVIGTFGEGRWNGVADRLTLQAGVRAEHINRKALAANPSPFAPRPAFPDDVVVSVNPKIAAAWLVTPMTPAARAWTRVRGAFGTGIRPPDAFEIALTDNPSLKPERSRSAEAGVTQTFAGGAVSLDATVFCNFYDDLIVSVGRLSDVSHYRTDNISNARARGAEFGAAWRDNGGLMVRATYTYLDAEIRAIDGTSQAPAPYQVGDRLLRRPRHQGSLDVMWTRGRTSAFASTIARGVTLDAEPSFGPSGGLYENPGRAVLDAGGSVRLSRGIEAYARVQNLFDRAYEEVLGYPAPGRTAFAGVRLAAGR